MSADQKQPIRALFFDAGNTILKPVKEPAILYAGVFRRWGLDVSNDQVQEVFPTAWRQVNTRFLEGEDKFTLTPGGEKSFWRDFVERVIGELGAVDDFDGCFNDLYRLFRRAGTWTLYPEVPALLKSLHERKLPLGIISNWDSSLLTIMNVLELTHHFTVIFISGLVGVAKPNPSIFTRAAEAIQVPVEACLHVGDNPTDDCLGARNAGFETLLIDRGGNHNGDYPSIRSLREIISWLN